MKKNENKLDDLVIKVLSHQERKRILKIVGSYTEGVTYTGILGETGLSTGRLNYHLGELEGFLERNDDRLYTLGVLGRKAVATLSFINEDIDMAILEIVNSKRASRLKSIKRRLKIGFYAITMILFSINVIMGYFALTNNDTVLAVFTGIWLLMSSGIIFMTDKSRKNDPERILWVWEWLEWKLVGNYDK